MAAPSAAAEAAVKKLARMGGNTICPNCGTEKKFGFGTVCMKFLTFVCNECKSSHQAISHRCKSLTMSSWTEGEVLQLRTVGGNDRARATWLAAAPPTGQNGRPMTGSSIDVYKSFIVEVYERKKYYRESSIGNDIAATSVVAQQQSDPPLLATKLLRHQQLNEPTQQQHVQPSAQQAEVDLLDFGAFDTVAPSKPVQSSSDCFAVADTFQGFAEPPAGVAATASQPTIFDPFGISGSTNQSTNGAFGVSNASFNGAVPGANVANLGSFDPFGSSSASPQIPLEQKKAPIMNNPMVNGANSIGLMMMNTPSNNGFTMNNGFTNGMNNMLSNGNSFALGSTSTSSMMMNGAGLSYQPTNMQPFVSNPMVSNMADNPGQIMNTPGIINSSMMMNGAPSNGMSINNNIRGNYGMVNSGGGSVMIKNSTGNSGGMVMNVMPGGNSMNRISTNFDGRSQQPSKPDPFASLGLDCSSCSK